jgi:hypothetical protein
MTWRSKMELLLGLICAWVAITAAALGAALTDRAGGWGGYLVAASVVIGVAISSTMLMLP